MLYIHSIEKLIDNLPFVWYDLLYKSYFRSENNGITK